VTALHQQAERPVPALAPTAAPGIERAATRSAAEPRRRSLAGVLLIAYLVAALAAAGVLLALSVLETSEYDRDAYSITR
jgi:hypothetical protein